MIISSKEYSTYSIVKNIMNTFKSFLLEFRVMYLATQLMNDRVNLKKYFKMFYPTLKKNTDGEFICVGCKLCQTICPSTSIKLDFPKLVNFPASLKVGELPNHFYLDMDACLQCGLCYVICPVDAFSMAETQVRNPIVDLVSTQAPLEISHLV